MLDIQEVIVLHLYAFHFPLLIKLPNHSGLFLPPNLGL